jgi:hypothetical protein
VRRLTFVALTLSALALASVLTACGSTPTPEETHHDDDHAAMSAQAAAVSLRTTKLAAESFTKALRAASAQTTTTTTEAPTTTTTTTTTLPSDLGYVWPNGGTLAPHTLIQTPSGEWELHPLRCAPVWEDGSSECPDWQGNR